MIRAEQVFTIYEKIKLSIIKQIETGKLRPDDKVASETQLAKQFNASRMTANRALKELAQEGRIIRIQGVGSFVARPEPDAALLEITSISKQIRQWGGQHSSRILLMAQEEAGQDISQELDLIENDPVFHSIIVHMDKEVPIQYSERYINPKVAPDYLLQDFTRATPSDYLLETAPVQKAEHRIQAILCPEPVRMQLNISAQEPCLCLTRKTWSFDVTATFSKIISPGSRYSLFGNFKRG